MVQASGTELSDRYSEIGKRRRKLPCGRRCSAPILTVRPRGRLKLVVLSFLIDTGRYADKAVEVWETIYLLTKSLSIICTTLLLCISAKHGQPNNCGCSSQAYTGFYHKSYCRGIQ